ncbi:MAG: hypothetical protein JW757_02330 [Anaerolineales bacterium]|nr:hypothetical protein [Anaerolineales bacterium]
MKRTLLTLLLLILLTACAPVPPPSGQPVIEQIITESQQPTQENPPPKEPASQQEAISTLSANQIDSLSQDQPVQTEDRSYSANNFTIPGTAEIAILRPGQYSRLVSPIRLIASFSNPEDALTFITLYGEDGRVLAERKFDILPYDDPVNGNVITDLEFSIEAMNEVGRLELKVVDQFGRLRALNSVNLILLADGPADRNYAPEDGERILPQIPFPGQTEIEGGKLFLSGLVRLTPTIQTGEPHPLNIHLVDQTGTIIAQGWAPVVVSSGSQVGQYVAEIEYQVTEPTPVLLAIGIIEGRFIDPAYVKTFSIILNP